MDIRDEIYAALSAKQYAQAEEKIHELLRDPDAAVEAWGLMTSMYIEQAEVDKAQKAFHQLSELAPEDSYTLFLQARIHFMQGRHYGCIAELEAALAKGKNSSRAVGEKICNLLGQCYRLFGNCEKSIQYYHKAVEYADSHEFKALEYTNYLFNLHYSANYTAQQKFRAHQRYGELFREVPPFYHRIRRQKQKIRLGYISPDFRNHVVLRFCYGLLTQYDRDRFEVFCYARCLEDDWSRQLLKQVDGWRNLYFMSELEAARCIYEDQIDILFDLSGHTQGSCLPVLAYKPAPVQISGIGYFDTTGLPTVDYFWGDPYLDENNDADFTEEILRLPRSHFCYTPLNHVPEPQMAPCQKNGYITFGSFNNFTKVSDEVLRVWSRILDRVPDSRLLLKSQLFSEPEGCSLVKKRLEGLGIHWQRIELRGESREYLPEYYDMDVALDTFPYPGGGTTCDALYMGVPVISLRGKSHGERFGYSILMNAGLGEFCAADTDAYVDKVVALAQDPELLNLLHLRLRTMLQHSPLMDVAGYLQEAEQVYQRIWGDFCQKRQSGVRGKASRLLPVLSDFVVKGDSQQALAVADHIMVVQPRERYILEKVAAAYIDYGDAQQAETAAAYLQKLIGGYGYGFFLQASAAYMQQNLQQSETYALRALQDDHMEKWQKGITYNLLARIYKDLGKSEQAVANYQRSAECKEIINGKTYEYSNYLFALHYLKRSPEFMYAAAQQYEKLFGDIPRYHHSRKMRHEKIRVGYISADLCSHIVALFSQTFFSAYDRNCYEIRCYARCREDAVSRKIQSQVDHWCNISGWPDAVIAERIFEDEIDILVDLGGHTKNNCLPVLAYKPAPVQISGIGYFDTTGLTAVDYFLADVYTDPEGENDSCFTEQLLRLPHSHFCYTPADGAPGRCPPAPWRKNGFITFGSLNNFAKVTDEMLGLWAAVLRQVPKSRLFLKAAVFDNDYGRELALQRIKMAGIPEKRLLWEGYTKDYLQAYAKIDIALDTYPYPGGGTTCDALYMGVPVITLVGQRHNARFGYSLLMNIGLEECCAFSAEDYVRIAIHLASRREHISELHQTLRRRMRQSAVMDAGIYMPELEAAYQKVWQRWLREGPVLSCVEITAGLRSVADKLAKENWPGVVRLVNQLTGQGIQQAKMYAAAGLAYRQMEDYIRAIYWLRKAIREPAVETLELYSMLGYALKSVTHHVEANCALEHTCLPECTAGRDAHVKSTVWTSLAYSRLILGREDTADAYYRAYEEADELVAQSDQYGSWLFSLHFSDMGQEELFRLHIGYQELFCQVIPYHYQARKGHKKKLRIGYISPDFRHHVMYSFYFQILASYDRNSFEVYCYSMRDTVDEFTYSIRGVVDGWRDVSGQSYAETAQKIYEDGIDILFDLAGHTADSGLPVMAWKPAPIQISGIGYMNTTGLNTVDYFLTDAWTDPVGRSEQYFTEKLLRMTSQFCYNGIANLPESTGTPCKQKGYILFGVFNHYYKITDKILLAWKSILEQVPKSKLLLKSQILVSDSVVDLAYERLKKLGMDMDRIWFEPATSDYMYRYLEIDIALDTFPYPGGGTTCDALYMGVPVVSLYGHRHASRFGLSILQNAGIGELAVDSLEQYVAKAVALAKDEELLNLLHQKLRKMMRKSPLLDASAYMTELENNYRAIWQEYEEKW